MKNMVVVIFKDAKKNISVDIEVPVDISARELLRALDQAYGLGIDVDDITKCHLQMENPIFLFRGNKLLADGGIRDGSIIYYTEGD